MSCEQEAHFPCCMTWHWALVKNSSTWAYLFVVSWSVVPSCQKFFHTQFLFSCNYKVSSFAVFGSVWLLFLFWLRSFKTVWTFVCELFQKCFNLDCYSSEPDRSVKALLIQSPSLWFLFWVGYWGDWFFYWYTLATRVPLYLVLLDFIYPLTLYIWWIIQQLQLSTFNGGIFKNQKKMQPGLESILEKIKIKI